MSHAQARQARVIDKNIIQITTPSSYDFRRIIKILDLNPSKQEQFCEALPFSLNDATAGVENELQTVVLGSRDHVDLPMFIRDSNYYRNIQRRHQTGDTPRRAVTDLDRYLEENVDSVWENSWVRFPIECLCDYAKSVFTEDIRADKSVCDSRQRSDANQFCVIQGGRKLLRIPISYLLKIALADAIGRGSAPDMVKDTGARLLDHFLSDNTSPETFSFYPSSLSPDRGMGRAIAKETLKRYLLCQLLVQYANSRFRLREAGQRAMVYFAPHPPIRQKLLNDLISDSFYRELFMSPCLSGWDKGEEKHRYMGLCHQMLSRSQINAVAKLRDAGIISNNLIVLPTLSNISLANNGTHISLGSRKLTRLLKHDGSGFRPVHEKSIGDLVIKIVEHFLPLFVGTYSSAPYRLDFQDFHPEKALGFLAHELDFTHLRMFWRRWRKKAHLNLMGQPLTPFGPECLDRWISRLFRLRGDVVADFRLIDYLVCLMSTDQSPALDGRLGNDARLKKDLSDLGVFDPSMSMYLIYKLRQYSVMGFSGYEGRHYSLFDDLEMDMGHAANLQVLLTALAWKYVLSGDLQHASIPNEPFLESERRQIFFGSAVGIPTFFVRRDTPNRFLESILKETRGTRHSRRYKGYVRVKNLEYRKALIRRIRTDAADLIELMGLEDTIADLELRTMESEMAASEKLTTGILEEAGASHPLKLTADEFNSAAERYYRGHLRKRHIGSALEQFKMDLKNLDSWQMWRNGRYSKDMLRILGGRNAARLVESFESNILEETTPLHALQKLIFLMLLTIHQDIQNAQGDTS